MISSKEDIINLEHYELQDKIDSNDNWKFYKIMNLTNGEKYLAKHLKNDIDHFTKDILIDFSREVDISSRVNHPSILQYTGYTLSNFKKKKRPAIITKYPSNCTLYKLISQDGNLDSNFLSKWDDTKKLISLYGISSAMLYLHSHNILHRGLNIENIYLDDNLHPKLYGFDFSVEIPEHSDMTDLINESKAKGTPRYLSPEILSHFEYSKSSDVYAFGIVMCEIMNNEIPFKDFKYLKNFVSEILKEGHRPNINSNIPECYQNLIKRCWTEKADERPTFNEIVTELKTNLDFITSQVNKDEFQNYVKLIDSSIPTFSEEKRPHKELYELLQPKSGPFDNTKIDSNLRGTTYNGKNIDLTKYALKEAYDEERQGYKIYDCVLKNEQPMTIEQKLEILMIESEEEQEKIVFDIKSRSFHAHVYSKEINEFNKHEIINFTRKLSILSQINHPAILNFIGYSPIDFDNKNRPVILTETSEGKIANIREDCDYTRRLIYIYGIASAMAYLHSHGIIHRDLKPSNIYLDYYDLPKVTGFDISKEIDQELESEKHKIKGTPVYLAPEVYMNQKYSKSSDVYSFGFIVYQIMTGKKKPFKKIINPNELKRIICEENERPKFKLPIAKAYRNLIERCWSQNPDERPTFDSIVDELKTNPKFITDEVDKEFYFKYIKFLDDFQVEFNTSNRISQYDDIFTSKLHTFKEIDSYPGLKDMFCTETNDLSFKYNFFNTSGFKKTRHKTGYFYDVRKLFNADTNEEYAMKSPNERLEKYTKSETKNFIRETGIISQLNHPSILEYIGYNPEGSVVNMPIIIMEFSTNGSLYEFIEKTKTNNKDKGKKDKGKDGFEANDKDEKDKDDEPELNWNDTKKLIYLYGIASAMSYLHSHNIIHRDLKPGNVFLDKSLHPKLSGFNISKYANNESFTKSYKLKGTPAYLAPEVYLNHEYSKSSDVYSYGLIMYEIITGEKPFDEHKSPKEIKQIICDRKERPELTESIGRAYRDIIGRCWSQNPGERPSFDSIVNELKTNPDFITDGIDKEEYFNYIKMIEESPVSFDPSKKITYLDHIIMNTVDEHHIKNSKINLSSIYDTEADNILLNYDFIDIKNYEKQKLIDVQFQFKLHKIVDKQTNTLYRSKRATENGWYEHLVLDNEIDLLMELKHHPSFLKFVGYSPFDFKNRKLPTLITEYGSNGTLESVLELDIKNPTDLILDPTKRLINIYGIASAMSYLHSINRIHCELKPSNIHLDEFLFPRISEFKESKLLSENPIPNLGKLSIVLTMNDDNYYMSPEEFVFGVKCSASDVYSFSMIAYQLITNERPFEELNSDLFEQVHYQNVRPKFNENVPECYKNLIEKCWSPDPKDRPTSDEIVYHLRSNSDFISGSINKDEFESYINYIDEIQSIKGNRLQLDDFFKSKNQTFRKVEIDMKSIRNPTKLNFSISMGSINLDSYEKVDKIGSGSFGVVYKVLEKETCNQYAAKISIYEMDQCQNDSIINLSREINIISRLKHPSIIEFIGFSPRNFKNKPKPIIITEYASNCSLDAIIENERNGFGNYDWNDTKKLINIYGIASGMAYLHKLNILHRDLKPGNILLDDYLYPKIADFGLSRIITDEDEFENQQNTYVTSGFKGTYAYCAPEIIEKQLYSKAGDVYAFAMIVYEIMTNNTPFLGYNQYRLLIDVLNNVRPKFDFQIPYCYRRLIEKCWSNSYRSRPEFSEIVKLLETDRNFITPNVDEDEYLDYISLVKESQKQCVIQINNNESNNESNKESNKESIQVKKEIEKSSEKVKVIETEDDQDANANASGIDGDDNNKCFLSLKNYERKDLICKSDLSKLYKFENIETGQIYIGQMSMNKINKLSKSEIDDLSIELEKVNKLSHPCLLKFVGYSPVDFKKQPKPVIVTEYFANGSLSDILEIERIQKADDFQGWNETKKLINIYGIASGMSYLHSQNILHKSLKPSNIYLDDVLTPKIGDFGLSTRFSSSESITVQSISGVKATPVYSSPEILLNNEYSKSSDVYAFAFVVFEIVSNEIPFNEITNNNQIFKEVVMNQNRPKLKESIPASFRNLIQRCWSQNPSERPTFDEIVYLLKMDSGFINDKVDVDDYQKYIEFVEKQIQQKTQQKIDEIERIKE